MIPPKGTMARAYAELAVRWRQFMRALRAELRRLAWWAVVA